MTNKTEQSISNSQAKQDASLPGRDHDPDIESREAKRRVLPAGQWLRVVLGSNTPFGQDGMPTVLG
jgi:hypothetical protein